MISWQMGPKATAGIAAVGVAADADPEMLEHAASYQSPAGARSARRTQFVEIVEVFDDLRVSHPELKARPEFSDNSFELSVCPNRPNALRIKRARLLYILGTLYRSEEAA